MKYMQTGGFQNNPFMRTTLLFTVLFLTGLWITNFALYFSKMGLTPASVESYYLGSEALFTPARSYQSMLEVSHTHLPMMGMVILLVTHLLIFAPFSDRAKVAVIVTTFLAGLFNEGSSWLVRFVSPDFALLKVVSFLVFQGALGFSLASLATFLIQSGKERKKKRSS